jgi:hypothetical protein
MPKKANTVQFYKIPAHGRLNSWCLLGNYTLDVENNGGYGDLKLELNAHSGWDSVNMSQDNMYILRFKAGSLAAMATNAFRGSAIAYDLWSE